MRSQSHVRNPSCNQPPGRFQPADGVLVFQEPAVRRWQSLFLCRRTIHHTPLRTPEIAGQARKDSVKKRQRVVCAALRLVSEQSCLNWKSDLDAAKAALRCRTDTELALRLGVLQSRISNYRTGRTLPDLVMARLIATALSMQSGREHAVHEVLKERSGPALRPSRRAYA